MGAFATTYKAMMIYNIRATPFDKSDSDDGIHSTVFFSKRLTTRGHDRIPRILIPARLRVGRKSIICASIDP
jgi:hypothetical protein